MACRALEPGDSSISRRDSSLCRGESKPEVTPHFVAVTLQFVEARASRFQCPAKARGCTLA
eukprot:2481612-Rhodomonas_salina.2